ncbi:MAG: hypothetical protein Q4G70_01815 [Pseudomonadota bacterium]|nr:hypothetical protein [Pseudomonadota bacterium]
MTTNKDDVKSALFAWIDAKLSGEIPEHTVAYHFNLYEGTDSVHVQLVGTSTFDAGENPETDYWPGEETFSTDDDVLEIPFTVAGPDWQAWLKTSTELLNDYLATGKMSAVLKQSAGVGAGFVDGDMYLLWRA